MRPILLSLLTVLAGLVGPAGAQDPVQEPVRLVRSWYQRFLDRRVEDAGLIGWAGHLQRGVPPEQVLSMILGSEEYYTRSGLTPQGFVRNLFTDITGRQPTPNELAFWLRRMQFQDRQQVAYEVLARHPGSWQAAPFRYPQDDPSYDYRRPTGRWR